MNKSTDHEVDIVGEHHPGTFDIRYERLTAEFSLCSDLERYASDFSGEHRQLGDLDIVQPR